MNDLNDAMRAFLDKTLFSGYEPTISYEPPTEMLQGQNIADMLRKMVRDLRDRDPLLQRGIPVDYVCVVNPALVPALKAEYERMNTMSFSLQPASFLALNWLSILLGRQVHEIVEAPLDRIEYMSVIDMYRRYPANVMRQLRALKYQAMRERRAGADSARQGGQGI